ncbi:MAG TPA: trypsin-like peptidase domain-containing protein [Burkholderiales bacterium]
MRRSVYSRAAPTRVGETPSPPPAPREARWRKLYTRHEKALLALGGALVALAVVLGEAALDAPPPQLTQEDIDHAVARTLQKIPVPSPAVRAYEAVRASVVRVTALRDEPQAAEAPTGLRHGATGSGVVIVDRGVILTSLHVVSGAERVRVTFANGLQSDASVVSRHPENDLAVLLAKQIPDDLRAATLGPAKDLVEGEHVTAVGFPFGIGPSVSAGVISGLHREYAPPDGERHLSDLIQFDAAANPGSSGGPLVNATGEVVGIVTAILSPDETPGFSGIAFAVPIEAAAGAAGLPPF